MSHTTTEMVVLVVLNFRSHVISYFQETYPFLGCLTSFSLLLEKYSLLYLHTAVQLAERLKLASHQCNSSIKEILSVYVEQQCFFWNSGFFPQGHKKRKRERRCAQSFDNFQKTYTYSTILLVVSIIFAPPYSPIVPYFQSYEFKMRYYM